MKIYVLLAAIALALAFNPSAYAVWIDAKTGEPVQVEPYIDPTKGIRNGNPDEVPYTQAHYHGYNLYWDVNCKTWKDGATGREVQVEPYIDPTKGIRNGNPDEVPYTQAHYHGHNLVWVPCPEEKASSTTGGSSAIGATPAAQFAGFYMGLAGTANFALSSSQTLRFNIDGRSDQEVSNSRSAVGGGVNVIMGIDFHPFNIGSVPLQVATVMNVSYSGTNIETPFGASTLHFSQNLYTVGVDGRLRFLTGTPFTPFVEGGFGLGISQGSFDISSGGSNLSLGHTCALAPVAQLGTGVDFKITGAWSIYLEGKAAIPIGSYDYRLNNVSGLGGGDASIKSNTPIDLGIDLGAKINF